MKASLILLQIFIFCNCALAGDKQNAIYVIGNVNSPGAFPFQKDISAWDAIQAAGGINRLGKHKFVIKRKENDSSEVAYRYDFTELSKEKQIEKMKSIILKPADIIWIYDREQAYLFETEPVDADNQITRP